MHEYKTGGNCRWVVWDSNDSSYEYVVKVACDPASDSRAKMFRIDSSLPNASAPSGYSELAVVNGSIFASDSGSYVVGGLAYNLGGNVTLYQYNGVQTNWGSTPRDYNYLTMYTWGGGQMNFTTTYNMDAGGAAVTLGCTARADGTGESGASATTSHAFIGSSGTINYFGYSTGISGAATVNYMKSQYGGTCAILDGGGSTYLRYLGSTKQSSTRPIHNGLVVYYKQRSTPPTPPTPDPNPPVKPSGSYDTTKMSGSVIGKSYVLKNGSLKPTQPFYAMLGGTLKERPLKVCMMVDNALKTLIQKV